MTSRKNINWDAQPLGVLTDSEIASRLGVSVAAVGVARRKRGISRAVTLCYSGIDWTTVDFENKSDGQISRELGVTRQSCRVQRKRLGYKPFASVHKGIDWDKQPLGIETDIAIAKKLGVSQATVSYARNIRGIPIAPSRKNICVDWDNEPLLGAVGDSVLARELGVSVTTVSRHRELRGIPAVDRRGSRYDWGKFKLGIESDAEIARKAGCKPEIVAKARWRLGIPCKQDGGYVYAIGAKDDSFVKIGVCSRLKKDGSVPRLAPIQTGNPRKLETIAVIHTTEYLLVERDIHRVLSWYRGVGEWFNIGRDAAFSMLGALESGASAQDAAIGAGLKRAIITQSEDSTNEPRPSHVKGKKTT